MKGVYIEDKTFDKADFTKEFLTKGEYESCTFIRCDFSNSDLSDRKFLNCEFVDCNLSLAKLLMTAFNEVKFKGNKMLGLHFESCQELGFSVSFDNCVLTHASFYRTKLKKTLFRNVQLHEVDFTECDLTGSVFDNCDLAMAIFENTVLEKADLRMSFNYSIDPERNRIKKAKFSLYGVTGLLSKYDIIIEGAN